MTEDDLAVIDDKDGRADVIGEGGLDAVGEGGVWGFSFVCV